jgi:hypothetical protein
VQSGAPRHFQIHHREADRNPDPAIQDFVDEAVPRIVVAVAVS